MIPRFFIDRPIFAAVLSIVITLTGGIALMSLPIAQYPQITPPAVQVSIAYPGASAQIVMDTVAAPIEQQVNGVPGMMYMSSQMGNDGSYSLSVTFDVGVNLNTALVMVQNRVMLAMPQLPTEVQKQGITIRKKTPDLLLVISFFSPDGRYDDIYLSNFVLINLKDELLRVDGVSDISILGERDYSIRAWLDPQKMTSLNMTTVDVITAIRQQNVEAVAGQVGQPPIGPRALFQRPIDTLGRLMTPEQFGDIIVKVGLGKTSAPSTAVPRSPGTPPTALPGSGVTDPLMAALSPSAPGSGLLGGGSAAPSGKTGSGTTSSGKTGGSATSGTTGGAASSNTPSSGTTASASTGTPPGSSSTPNSTPASDFSGLSINGGAGAAASLGILSGTVLGRGPGRPDAGIVRLKDVARVEMGAKNYNQSSTFDGRPAVGIGVFQLPGTNALDVADRVRARMAELQGRFPEGIAYVIGYDTTPFIRESVYDVVRTLFEAVVLVGGVVLLFLQSWRAVLIPMTAVPVAIVGTFAVMAAVGFSLNNISLFGLVLAIGIVVDDAIVVVENVERWLEHGLDSRSATRKAMDEVTGPVIAVALVLCAVFVPCAFISGITGRFFRQFAVTISVSTIFSAINSLTLSPALAAILLRPHTAKRDPVGWTLQLLLGWLFRAFNWTFNVGTAGYAWMVGALLRLSLIVLIGYAGLLALTAWVFRVAPSGFVPEQDQGRLICSIQLPDAAALYRTQEAITLADEIARADPAVAHTITIGGMSFVQAANASNFGSMFIVLKPYEERRTPDMHANAVMARLRRAWAEKVREAQIIVFNAAPIPGLSVAGGFKLMVEDRGGLGLRNLEAQTSALIQRLSRQPGLAGVSTQFRSKTPQLFMDIDRTKVASLGVNFNDANQTLQVYLGSLYVNNFNEFGRDWQVTLQAEGKYRSHLSDINLLKVRNKWGQMVSMGTLVNVREIGGPIFVMRYNLYTAAPITGALLPGISTGEVIANVEDVAQQTLPLTMGTEWTELMFIQIRAGNTAVYVFALAVLCVFLALAALYESWALPLAVILVVPLCLLCSIAGVLFTKDSVNIFVQIGLVVLVGLACKNAILIVEFAKELRVQGKSRFEATKEASRLRLRPILMTSFAFILGVVPLVIATGAGAEMRRSLGTAVFSGMLGVTLFGIFLTPVFFYVIQGLSELRLFASTRLRMAGSAVIGGAIGIAFGILIERLVAVPLYLAAGLGGTAGVVLVSVLLLMHHRLVPRSVDRKEHSV